MPRYPDHHADGSLGPKPQAAVPFGAYLPLPWQVVFGIREKALELPPTPFREIKSQVRCRAGLLPLRVKQVHDVVSKGQVDGRSIDQALLI